VWGHQKLQMFISKKICYLELEKTAISSIREFFKKNISGGQITGVHNFVTKEMLNNDLFFVGSIRNPLDWYISRWSYGCMSNNSDSMYKNLTNKRLSYSRIKNIKGQNFKKLNYLKNQILKNKKYWIDLYSDPYDAKKFREWLKSVLDGNKKKDLAEQYYFSSLYGNFGYMTFRYLIMFTLPTKREFIFNNLVNYDELKSFDKEFNFINFFIKFENLDNNLEKLFNVLKLKIINKIKKINPSSRKPDINYYYDNECKEMVKHYEKYMFEKHNY